MDAAPESKKCFDDFQYHRLRIVRISMYLVQDNITSFYIQYDTFKAGSTEDDGRQLMGCQYFDTRPDQWL